MMNYKLFNKLTFLLVFSGMLLIGAAQQAVAATRTVTKIADTNDNVCNADCSLREAVTVAASGDQIVFQPALTGQTITLTLGVITINKNLTITGVDNLKISGFNKSRIFYTTGGAHVTINKLMLKDGLAQYPDALPGAAGDGGAILVGNSSTLSLNDSKVYSNNAFHGGAIAAFGNLKVKNTQIYGNSALYGGGGIFAYWVTETVEITDSIIKYNQAEWGGGFAMINGTLKMSGTSVYGNNATSDTSGGGGGLYLSGEQQLPTSFGTNFIIANSTISGNSAASGGGIYNFGNLSLINSTLSGNEATKYGGGLYHGTGGAFFGVVLLRNSTVTLNTANLSGGGIYRSGDTGEVNLGNTIVAANSNFNSSSPDLKGIVKSAGYNLFSSLNGAVMQGDLSGNKVVADPKLAPLNNYGGKTKTHLPDITSPAYNAGSNVLATDENGNQLIFDQRGESRFTYGTVDIGAVERLNERINPF